MGLNKSDPAAADEEAAAIWKRLTPAQKQTLLHYGAWREYGGNRQIARVFVRKLLANWDERGGEGLLWAVHWTPLGKRVYAYGQHLTKQGGA